MASDVNSTHARLSTVCGRRHRKRVARHQAHAGVRKHEASGLVRRFSRASLLGRTQITIWSERRYTPHIFDWCRSRPQINSSAGYDLLKRLFAWDPDQRITAKEALLHKWFQDEPRPTSKCVHHPLSVPHSRARPPAAVLTIHFRGASFSPHSAFQTISPSQMPPHRRITQDDAPSMVPAQASQQAAQAQMQAQFSQQPHLHSHTQGSAGSFASLSAGAVGVLGGAGMHGGHARKKARLG